MPKFSNKPSKVKTPTSVIATVPTGEDAGDAVPMTYEGREGGKREAKAELFMLAIRNMVGEDTFYEKSADRDKRFKNLIHKVAVEDPDWIARFVPYLRDTMNMRSASVVMAAESVWALLGKQNKDVSLRRIIDSAIVRGDEPAEMFAYWKAEKGGTLPKPVKRGLADAINRVINERSALKYDGQSRETRVGDVIDIVRPRPETEIQSRLYRWLLDRRHNREVVHSEGLPVIEAYNALQAIPQADRRAYLEANGPEVLRDAGMTWESVSGWIGGELTASVWEKIIPSMGYMALLRNLRNFERAGVSKDTVKYVTDKLTNPEQVAKSRQFPFRFYSAYLNTESNLWAQAIEEALDLSTQNIPELSGKTLVLVDLSGSMASPLTARSKVMNYQVGALFGGALAARHPDSARLIAFGTTSEEVRIPKGTSVLKLTKTVDDLQRGGKLGYGTETFPAIQKHYNGENRIVIFTDQQSFGPNRGWYNTQNAHAFVDNLPIPIYNFDLGGYETPQFKDMGKDNRYEFGGFSDQAFKMLDLLEKHKDVSWPF